MGSRASVASRTGQDAGLERFLASSVLRWAAACSTVSGGSMGDHGRLLWPPHPEDQ